MYISDVAYGDNTFRDHSAKMKQVLIVFAAVLVAAHAAGKWKPGLRVRWGRGPFPNPEYFIPLPQTLNEAKAKWVQSQPPAGTPKGLVLYTPSKDDVVIGTFYDVSGKVAGLQVAIPQEAFLDSELDWKTQGYKEWIAPANSKGLLRKYWAQMVFFRDPATFTSKSGSSLPGNEFIGDNIYLTGFNGKLVPAPNTADQVANTARTGFTEQGCIPYMGRHYFYHITKQSQCNSNTLLSWFTLLDTRKDANQLIGMGLVAFGKLPPTSLIKDYFERPTADAVISNVYNGPQCFGDLAKRTGVLTMHIYFIDQPTEVNCTGM